MTTTSTVTRQLVPTSAGRVATGIGAAVLGGWVVTAAVAYGALALGVSADFEPLRAPGYLVATVVGVLAGAVGWAVVRRRARRPDAVLRRLVPTVVGLSLLPDVALGFSDQPGVGALGIAALMLMHLLVAAVAVPALAWAMPLPGSDRSRGDVSASGG